MRKLLGYTQLVRCLILMLLLAGCANRQTYEESKYQFTEPQAVVLDQADWVLPKTLEIYRVASRNNICSICNDTAAGGKGSHFKVFGLHKVSIQDRGCYIYHDGERVGRVYYLAGDREARSHEIAHHFHGPRHENPRPWTRWRRLLTGNGYQSAGMTGSRIKKPARLLQYQQQ